MPSNSRSTLVILPNNLGDVVMATPVLEGLKRRDPGGRTSFLVEQGFEGALEQNPHCDRIVRFGRSAVRDELRSSDWRKGLAALRELVAVVNEEHFDAVINLCQHEYMSYCAPLFSGAGHLGKRCLSEGNDAVDDLWSQYLYSIPFSRRSNRLHAVDIYRRIAGVTGHRGGYSVVLTTEERRAAARLVESRGIDAAAAFIVLQPGAAIPSKRWPSEHFVTLGRLIVEAGKAVIVSGAPAERDLCDHVAFHIGSSAVSLAGETSFRQAIAVVSLASGCATGDTALMHAAAALDVPTYAFFGATNPVETGPYGDGHLVFAGKCVDRPCFCESCKTMLCMKSILPETVFGRMSGRAEAGDQKCEIYRTSLAPNGDYSLVPRSGQTVSYYDPGASHLALKVCDPGRETMAADNRDLAAAIDEAGRFATVLSAMVADLDAYRESHDAGHVKRFEARKDELIPFTGIGAFWTALLNIRLNSIPLLDPDKGIKLTRETCADLLARIRSAMHSTAPRPGR